MVVEAKERQRLAALQEAMLQGQPITAGAKKFVAGVRVERQSSVSVQSTMPTEAQQEDVAQSYLSREVIIVCKKMFRLHPLGPYR